jgi:exodeoxyribonuclease VII small subunit
MTTGKSKRDNPEKLSFEQCLEQLDTLVREMESGTIPLEEMIVKFEEGTALAAACHKKLDSLKQKIEMLQSSKTPGRRQEAQASAPESTRNSSLFRDEPF